jgi:hypothetical protein
MKKSVQCFLAVLMGLLAWAGVYGLPTLRGWLAPVLGVVTLVVGSLLRIVLPEHECPHPEQVMVRAPIWFGCFCGLFIGLCGYYGFMQI